MDIEKSDSNTMLIKKRKRAEEKFYFNVNYNENLYTSYIETYNEGM